MYTVYSTRWWILGVFSCISCFQSYSWLLYSAAATKTEVYYHTTQHWINFWLSLGPIGFLPGQVYVWWLLSRRNGVRNAVYFAVITLELGALIRLLPQAFRPFHGKGAAQITISVAQFVNALAGPAVMSVTSQLAVLWFPDNFRVTATAIAAQANGCGTLIGFVMIPYMADCCGITSLTWFLAGVSTVLFLAVLAYFPSTPPTPPSASASQSPEFSANVTISEAAGVKKALLDTYQAATNVHLHVLVCTTGAFGGGLSSAWSGLFDPMFKQLYPGSNSNDIFAGWMGFEVSVAMVIGATVSSALADRFFRKKKRHKLIAVLGSAMATVGFLVTMFQFPSPFNDKPLLIHTHVAIAVVFFWIGLGVGIPSAVTTDWAAELSFPLNAGVSCGLLNIWFNIFTGIIILIQNKIPYKWLNAIVGGLAVVATIIIAFIPQDFKRTDYENIVRSHHNNVKIDESVQNETLGVTASDSVPNNVQQSQHNALIVNHQNPNVAVPKSNRGRKPSANVSSNSSHYSSRNTESEEGYITYVPPKSSPANRSDYLAGDEPSSFSLYYDANRGHLVDPRASYSSSSAPPPIQREHSRTSSSSSERVPYTVRRTPPSHEDSKETTPLIGH